MVSCWSVQAAHRSATWPASRNSWLILRHAGSQTDSLRAKAGAAAKLTVKEPDRGRIHFARYVPFSPSPVKPPARNSDPALVTGPGAEAAR